MWGFAVAFFMIVTSHFVVARPIINKFYLTTFVCLRKIVKHFQFRRLVHHYCFILELIKLDIKGEKPEVVVLDVKVSNDFKLTT